MLVGLDPLTRIGAVLVVLLLILSWLARRNAGASGRKGERVMLTAQHGVHLVEIGGVRLLVGTGPSGAPQVLAELGPVEAEAEASEPAPAPATRVLELLGVAGGR